MSEAREFVTTQDITIPAGTVVRDRGTVFLAPTTIPGLDVLVVRSIPQALSLGIVEPVSEAVG